VATDARNISYLFPHGTHTVDLNLSSTATPYTYTNTTKLIFSNTTLQADFNGTPRWGNPFDTINFVDMSAGENLNNWSWDLGDRKNQTYVRNPFFMYNLTGNYNVNLTVKGADGQSIVNKTSYIRINNNNTFTLILRDADDFSLITTPDTVKLSQLGVDYVSNITQNGVTSFELPDGAYDVMAAAIAGLYDSNIASVTMAGTDASGTIYLTLVSSGSKTTWYSPHQVKFDVIDTNNVGTSGFIINATYTDTSLPLKSTVEWLKGFYGVSEAVAADMMNNTLVMNATAGSDGSVTMTMHQSLQYRIIVFDPATKTTSITLLYPKDDEYKLFITTQSATASTYSQVNGTILTFYEPSIYTVRPGLQYQDLSGRTQYFNFSVLCNNNNTYIYTSNVTSPGISKYLVNITFPNVRGEMYTWMYSATRT